MSSARWGAFGLLAIFVFIVCAALTLLAIDTPFDPNQSNYQGPKTSTDQCHPKLRPFGLDVPAQSGDPVNQNSDKREKADLCQQIRMADAAEEAADTAWRQYVVSKWALFGLFLTVVFTGLAWKAARDAANHAESTANVAKQTLIESQRAWIRRDKITFDTPLTFTEDGVAITSVALEFTNIGNAPALNIEKHVVLLPGTNGEFPRKRAEALFAKWREYPPSGGFALFPGQTYPRPRDVPVPNSVHLTKDEVDSCSDNRGRMTFYLAVCINYALSTDPTKNRQTSCLFEVGSNLGWISKDRGEISDLKVKLEGVGFHSIDTAD